MKILYCNNYCCNHDTVKRIKSGEYPRNHFWGIFDLIEQKKDDIFLSESPNLNKIKNRFFRLIKTIKYQLKLFIQYKNIDCVYAACGHLIDIFALMKKLKLFNGKIVCVIHHPCNLLFVNSYDRVVFISKYTQGIMKKKYPKIRDQYIFWGPDLKFYKQIKNVEKEIDIYSNGKTMRDYDLIAEFIERNQSIKSIILGFKDEQYGNYIYRTSVSDIENISICAKSKVMVIPVKRNSKLIVGLTSLTDAIALQIPVLISSGTNLGFSVEELGLGLEYEAENIEDFELKLKLILKNYSSFSTSIVSFSKENNYETFSKEILSILRGTKNE